MFAVVAAFKPGADITNTAWVDEGATAEVTKAGTEAIETLYTYSYETIDQDFEKARGYLNDAKRDEFDSTADTTKEAAIQTKTATQASVTDIGVTVLDGDRAELLAHMNVSAPVMPWLRAVPRPRCRSRWRRSTASGCCPTSPTARLILTPGKN